MLGGAAEGGRCDSDTVKLHGGPAGKVLSLAIYSRGLLKSKIPGYYSSLDRPSATVLLLAWREAMASNMRCESGVGTPRAQFCRPPHDRLAGKGRRMCKS